MPVEYIRNIQTGNTVRPIKDAEAWKLFSGSWLYGKTVVMYGDSTLTVTDNYADKLAATGIPASVTKRAVAGHSLTGNGLNIILAAQDLQDFDYVFICYGINDWSGVVRNSWKSALRLAIEDVLSKGSEPVVVLPWLVYIPTLVSGGWINNKGCSMNTYVDAAIAVCEEYSVKYFNFYTQSGVNKNNYTTLLTPSSNGLFLHEGATLADEIVKLIVNGNFCTGSCLSGKYLQPSKAVMPVDYGYNDELTTRQILANNCPAEFRKGRITSIGARTCTFLGWSTGARVRISGFYANNNSGSMLIKALNYYDNQLTTICRVDAGSDFDFTFEPPGNGGCWSLIAVGSDNSSGMVMDFTISAETGTVRICGTDPSRAAVELTYDEDFTVVDKCRIIFTPDGAAHMTGFTGSLGTAHPATLEIPFGTLPFYPQRIAYGYCEVDGGAPAIYKITQSGTVRIVFNETYTADTLVRVSGMDVTPGEFFQPTPT